MVSQNHDAILPPLEPQNPSPLSENHHNSATYQDQDPGDTIMADAQSPRASTSKEPIGQEVDTDTQEELERQASQSDAAADLDEDSLVYSGDSEDEDIQYLAMSRCRDRPPTPVSVSSCFHKNVKRANSDPIPLPEKKRRRSKPAMSVERVVGGVNGSFSEGLPVYGVLVNRSQSSKCRSQKDHLSSGPKIFSHAKATTSAPNASRLWLKVHSPSIDSNITLANFVDPRNPKEMDALAQCVSLTLAGCDNSQIRKSANPQSEETSIACLSHLLRDLVPLLKNLTRLDLHRFTSSTGSAAWLSTLNCSTLTEVHLGFTSLCVISTLKSVTLLIFSF